MTAILGIFVSVRLCAITAIGLVGLAVPAIAQPSSDAPAVTTSTADTSNSSAERDTYLPDYFAQFQPDTALDMVNRIPGFTLRGGGNARGFGEANTNFLVNGRRPSTKSQGAGDILSRIPATIVTRLEILDGASLDIPGLSGQVVNIVATSVALSGRWRYSARFEEGTEPQLLEGEVSLTGKRGYLDFSLGIESGQFLLTEDSVEQFFDGTGTLIEDRTEDIFLRNLQPSANLNLSWVPLTGRMAGHVANLNGSIEFDNDNSGVRESFVAVGPGGTNGESFVNSGDDEVEYEISGDYAFDLPLFGRDGTLKLIGLLSREDNQRDTVFVVAPQGGDAIRSIFLRDQQEGETIGRVEYGFKANATHDVQLSVEYALNTLDSTTTFENNFTPPVLDTVRVEEDRYNARITDSWQISPTWSLQSSLGAEYSRLQVKEPRSDARTFFRPKGFMSVSHQLSERYSIRAQVERGVGQLNFGTFVSTRNLVDNQQTTGNAEIKPDQFWNVSMEFERTDDKLISGRIRPYYRVIEDPIDRILFPDGTEGPGNLDRATRYGVQTNATLLFDTLGVPGLRLEATGDLGDSRIDDPLTGQSRQINGNEEWDYSVFARYDMPGTDFAFTARASNDQGSPSFRLDDIREVVVDKPFASLSVIHKNFFGMQLTVSGTNLLDNRIEQERQRFDDPDLRLGDRTRIERFARQRGRRLSITLTDVF